MPDKTVSSKNVESRRAEADKTKVETERSIEVAKMKQAHSLIEDIEMRRNLPQIFSLDRRIRSHQERLGTVKYALWLMGQANQSLPYEDSEIIKGLIKIYQSIRLDFKEIMNMRDERLDSLFPEIPTYFETTTQALSILENIEAQEIQMKDYSIRLR